MHIICVNCSAFYIGKLVRKFFRGKAGGKRYDFWQSSLI